MCHVIADTHPDEFRARIHKSDAIIQQSVVGAIDKPPHMVVDNQGDILIADENNHRIVVLGPNLNYCGFIEAPEC